MIEFRGVGKTYRSGIRRPAVRAVDDLSLQIADGEVLGIAGPNGAGKTTLIAMLLGYVAPSDGSVLIEGRKPRDYIEEHGIGYLSELVNIPPGWTVQSALERYALLGGLSDVDLSARVEACIERLGLAEHRRKKVKALSKGTLQRLGLAQALLRDERITVLDEPTHGLDPVWTQRFRDIVHEIRAPNRCVLIASHNLDELERVADRVAIIDRGRLQRLVSTAHIGTESAPTSYRIAIASGAERVAAIAPNAVPLDRGEFGFEVPDLEALNSLVASLIADGIRIASVVPSRSRLEQYFRDVVKEER